MNRPSTKEIKRALMIARNNIQYHSEEFVCNALPNDEVGDYLRNYIMNALGTKNPTVTFGFGEMCSTFLTKSILSRKK